MLKIKYSLFWILLSMPSCLGAEKKLTIFCYEREEGNGQYLYKWINAPNKEVIKEEILKTKTDNPNSGKYFILAKKDWKLIDTRENNITTSLEDKKVDFYTRNELKKAFEKKNLEQVGLLVGIQYSYNYEKAYTPMKDAFEEYKESTQDDVDQNSSNPNLLQNVDQDDKKPNFFTVQNSFVPVILVTLVVAGLFLLWLNNKKAPSEDKTPKEKKLKTELRPKSKEIDDRQMKIQSNAKSDNPRSDTMRPTIETRQDVDA